MGKEFLEKTSQNIGNTWGNREVKLHQTNKLLSSKANIRMKRHPTECEKIFTKYSSKMG
jgi:hypothetical protein